LHVVDREDDPMPGSEHPQSAQERERDDAFVGAASVRFGERERSFERTALWPR
jgi:hypothetical protein